MNNLEDLLKEMTDHGSSLILNWGEDNGCWEVSWITGGERFTYVSNDIRHALAEVVAKADRRFTGA
jgi:hypothetical protein